jgi:hypothetical protein
VSPNLLRRILVAWLVVTVGLCAAVHATFALRMHDEHPSVVVASVWSGGTLVERAVVSAVGDSVAALDAARASHPSSALVYESVVGEAPLLEEPQALFALSLVGGRDGLAATIGDRTEYVTPDDLLARQAYEKGFSLPSLGLAAGIDVQVALALLSDRLGVSVSDIPRRARLRRVRFVRTVAGASLHAPVTAETMTDGDVFSAAVAAGEFLTRGVDADGRFRYLVDAPTNRTLPGYDWPRHAGATYFLAQVARMSRDPSVAWAALRAASWLRDHAMADCGPYRCIGDASVVDIGSTALAVIAFVEVARQELDPGYALVVPGLAAFLRSQQRVDGEFMHEFDRRSSKPVDVQLLYYSGEATLALSRAHALLGDPRDLEAAARALKHLSGPAWSFPGSRYYFGEEHWTCQAMTDLWDRSPNPQALDFCLRWQAYGRNLQYRALETPYDAEGAYGLGPFVAPRLTPAASRCEAGLATLEVALRGGPAADVELTGPAARAALTDQMRRSLAFLLRHQFRFGEGSANYPAYLVSDPEAIDGAMPASEVDWQLRIDFAQHAGSALLRWLRLSEIIGPGKGARLR